MTSLTKIYKILPPVVLPTRPPVVLVPPPEGNAHVDDLSQRRLQVPTVEVAVAEEEEVLLEAVAAEEEVLLEGVLLAEEVLLEGAVAVEVDDDVSIKTDSNVKWICYLKMPVNERTDIVFGTSPIPTP